ncbi:MAG: site-specific DNA-methyltransferase [Planctomycetes bacterium]|nr:site-specific DNA-methyltransferase [Planctomycetota bacterium]
MRRIGPKPNAPGGTPYEPTDARARDDAPRVLDPAQGYLLSLAEAESAGPQALIRQPRRAAAETPSEDSTQRAALDNAYAGALVERLDLRRLVTYVPNKELPVYNWFKYKEGFSRELVFRLLDRLGVGRSDVVLDPFAGCGTTLLACKEYGRTAVGLDILPIAVYVANIKLQDWPNLDVLVRAVDDLLSRPVRPPRSRFPELKIIDLAYDPRTRDDILFFKEEIDTFAEPVRGFLTLGLLSILEGVSRTSKDGQFLRLVERSIPAVRDALREQLMTMIVDISRQRRVLFKGHPGKATMLEGDAREMCLPRKYVGRIAAAITSPPYLNRYDYSRTYALELCLLCVRDPDDMRQIRHSLLRSHIEAREHQGKDVRLPALDEILSALGRRNLNNDRIPIMIRGYFEDMNLVIRSLAAYLRPGGRVALVVANAQFAGEHVPTDLMLSELAAQHGLATEEIWVTRYKGNSSQQMAQFGRRPVRESIVLLSKNGRVA